MTEVKFKLKSRVNLIDSPIGTFLEESDYCQLLPNGDLVQFELVSESDPSVKTLTPGYKFLYIEDGAIKAKDFELNFECVLDDLSEAQDIIHKATVFLDKAPTIFAKFQSTNIRRGILMYGPPGSGKSTIISSICKQLPKDKTLFLFWPTDVVSASGFKNFMSSVEFKDVDRIVLVIEDIGGVEARSGEMPSTSSLLSILDNAQGTFKHPVLFLATTNFIHLFNGTLTNRPGRFEHVVKVGTPNGEYRAKLLQFFGKDLVTEKDLCLIESKDFADFTPAHIKEAVIRSELYSISISESLQELLEHVKVFKKEFSESKNVGF